MTHRSADRPEGPPTLQERLATVAAIDPVVYAVVCMRRDHPVSQETLVSIVEHMSRRHEALMKQIVSAYAYAPPASIRVDWPEPPPEGEVDAHELQRRLKELGAR